MCGLIAQGNSTFRDVNFAKLINLFKEEREGESGCLGGLMLNLQALQNRLTLLRCL